MLRCICAPNLEVVTSIGGELWHGQAQNGVNFDFEVESITPQNNKDLNQVPLHLWSKFGDPSLNGWWVIARTSSWLRHGRTDGHTHTHRQMQATTISEGQSWPRVKMVFRVELFTISNKKLNRVRLPHVGVVDNISRNDLVICSSRKANYMTTWRAYIWRLPH